MDPNPIDIFAVASLTLASFVGSLHCGLMCGPLVCGQMAHSSTKRVNSSILLYNLGRLLSYTFLGVSLGFVATQLEGVLPQLSQYLAIGLGIAMMAMGLGFMTRSLPVPQPQALLKLSWKLPKPLVIFTLGLFTVFLPCAHLAPAIALAASGDSVLYGGLVMASYWMGTLPIMVLIPKIGHGAFFHFDKVKLQLVSNLFIVLAGGLTVYRGVMTCVH